MNRRNFLKSAGAAGIAATVPSAPLRAAPEEEARSIPPVPAGAPNILIFMPDQQNGATILPGSPVIKPHMDRFLQQSVAFTSAHCPAPHCCPSRASFLTGLYPSEHGVYNNVTTDTAIHPNPYPGVEYWSNWLKSAGYGMGYAGKLHVGRDVKPETCGFENLSALEQDSLRENEDRKGQQWTRSRRETANPADRHPGQMIRPDWTNVQLYQTQPDEGPKGYENHADYKIMQAGMAGIKRFAETGKPWCVMISNSGAHDNYDAPKKFVDMYDLSTIKLPESFKDTLDDKPRVYQRQRYQYWSQLSNEETRDSMRHYYAKCSMQDAIFGEMLDALEQTGQADNTLVIYVSDHGDYCAAHGLWFKGVPSFREAYHIPAVIRWPKVVHQPGRQVDALVDQVDWASTILEVCGIPAPKKLSGASLMPWLSGQTPASWRTASCTQLNGVELYYTQRIIMTKDWKYVYNGFDYDELYDRNADPHEMHNLAFPDLTAKRAEVQAGRGLRLDGSVPWPHLPPHLEDVRMDLMKQMWQFAAEHRDMLFNPYGTVALAPFGPGIGPNPATK